MVPGAALIKPQKTQSQRLDYMPIVTVDKGSVNSDVYGYCGLMLRHDSMVCPILFL